MEGWKRRRRATDTTHALPDVILGAGSKGKERGARDVIGARRISVLATTDCS